MILTSFTGRPAILKGINLVPRDPKDISIDGVERTARRFGELNDQKDPIRLRVGAGPAGAEGAEGKEGPAGEDGTKWYSGSGAPSGATGVVGDFYFRTDTDGVYKKTGASTWTLLADVTGAEGKEGKEGAEGKEGSPGAGLPEGVNDYGKVTALPGSPSDGDRCTFSTGGVRWKLEYDSSDEYWYKVGGPPLRAESETARSTNSATYVSLTGPLSLTAPLAGDYDIGIEASMSTVAAGEHPYISYAVGATAASDGWGAHNLVSEQTVNISEDATKRHTGVSKSAVVEEKARRVFSSTVTFANRRLWIDPIRVK
jgi:hypothetical protein